MSGPAAGVPRVLVVGAGVAGVAAARALRAGGLDVTVLERGRVPGGRAASRTVHGRRVDLGASYVTARDPRFAAVVEDWVRRGLARPWTDRFAVRRADGWGHSAGPLRYGTAAGMRSLVEDLAGDLDVRTSVEVARVGPGPQVDGERADAVVVALPDPQAERVLDGRPLPERAAVAGRRWEPVLALVAGFGSRSWDLDGCFVDPDAPGGAVLGWVADDGRRRGDGAPVLVAHSTSAFAARHLDDAGAAGPALVAALREALAVPEPDWTAVHRWSFARPAQARDTPYLLTPSGVGLCGDGWGSPRFETAWVSGTLLGEELARRLG